jgi:benzoyl-CoA 2,3-epoxidase subunit A
VNLAFSRVAGRPKQYVQDLIRERGDAVVEMLKDQDAYIYICGLKGMEQGVDEAFRDVCRQRHLDWDTLRPALLAQNRIHLETY